MLRFALAASLAATSLLLCTQNDAHSSQQVIGPGGPIQWSITQEPVLSFTIAGSTLAGTTHQQLTVYNNGLASISRLNEISIGGPSTGFVDKDVDVAYVPVGKVKRLQRALKNAGAFTLPDSASILADVPLTTVTVLQGETTALAHTYSYYLLGDAYAPASKVIGDFIESTFPGF